MLTALGQPGEPGEHGVEQELVPLSGGTFAMGSDDPFGYPQDGEGPVRQVQVAAFSIAATTVTAADYARFVAATGHRGTAERAGWSFVFAGLLPATTPPTRGVAAAPWWRAVPGADWASPVGPGSRWQDAPDHPVVHVSLADALAYCAWSGTALPSEEQWEYAARGGLEQATYPWGEELAPEGRHRMNVWQGEFPHRNTADDGWVGTAPVRSYPPNAFGLYETTGNVWEWCATRFDERTDAVVTKGGSYLCHASYCRRYRPAARQGLTASSTTGNVGFRVCGTVSDRAR